MFLSLIAVFNVASLFTWNLDHFTAPQFGWYIANQSIFTCKFFVFVQYASLQISGFLYSLVSVDRYFQVMSKPGLFISELPFGSRRSAYGWSIFVIILVVLLNGHLLIFNGYIETIVSNKTYEAIEVINNTELNVTQFCIFKNDVVRCYVSHLYEISPLWDKVQAVVYTFIPFIIMFIFNTLLIFNVLQRKSTSKLPSHNKKNKRLTISLIILTLSFLLLTAPGSVGYGFFVEYLYSQEAGHKAVAILLDSLMFSQQAILFYISYLSNKRVREVTKELICRKKTEELSNTTKNTTARKRANVF